MKQRIPFIEEFLLNEKDSLEDHADKFISDVLKMGTKKNLFDVYMKKNNIHESKLSEFVENVISKMRKDYL